MATCPDVDGPAQTVTPLELTRITGLGIATIRRKYLGGIIPHEKRGQFVHIPLEAVKRLFGEGNLNLKT